VRKTPNNQDNSKRSRNICLLIIILCLSVSHAGAQTSILTPLSITAQQLNPEQTIRYNKVLAQNMHANYQFVHVEALAAAQLNGKIAVSFTSAPCPVTYFKAENVEYNGDDSNYYWYGDLKYTDSASDCDLGSAMILARNGEHFGQIKIQDRVFELIELTGDIQLIAEINTDAIAEGSCGLARTTTTTTTTSGEPGNSFCKVRVLVLYTPAAKASEASISNRIDLSISQTKQAMLNSNVLPANLNIELAGKQEIDYVESVFVSTPSGGAGGVQVDLDKMISGSLRTEVEHYRSLYQADIVLILVKPNLSDRTNGISILQSAAEPFGVVQSAIATGVSYTFAHELGHILGADHEDNEGESTDPSTRTNIAHAHILHFKTTRGFWPFKRTYDNSQKTLVYGGSGGDPSVILNYSNPNVNHSSGAATGKFSSTLGARNAAQQFMNIACTVSDYYPTEPGNLSVSITFERVCAGQSSLVSSHVTGPSGTYLYEWRQSADGVTYGGVIGTAPNLSFTMPATSGAVFFQLKVSDPSGATAYTYRSPKPLPPHWCTGKFSPGPAVISGNNASKMMAINPVPAVNTASVTFELADPVADVAISLYDYTGRFIKNLYTGTGGQGFNKIPADVSGLSNGLYLVKLNAGTYNATQKLIVHH
jgi:hypothetical protein